MRTAAKILLIVVALGVTAWVGMLIYWQVRVARAIAVLEATASYTMRPCDLDRTPAQMASSDLDLAGIRALPTLVRSLQVTKRPEYLTEASILFRGIIAHAAYQGSFSEMERAEPGQDWFIPPESSEAVRERKCRLIQDWWRANGRRFAWTWRPWSRGTFAQ